MSKEGNKVDFDLSKLTLAELIKTYEEIISFQGYLKDNRLLLEEVNEDE